MGFFKNLKRSLGMAKRFKGGIKEVEAIAERVAEEEIEEMIAKEEVEHTHDDGTTHSHVDGDKKHTHESTEHTHDDGTTHSHVDGDKKHTHESKRLKKSEFLISKGLNDRPNSHLSIQAYEEYCETSKSGIR